MTFRKEVMIVPRGFDMPIALVPVEPDQSDHAPLVTGAENGGRARFRGGSTGLLDKRLVGRDRGTGALGCPVGDLDRAPSARRKRNRQPVGTVIDGSVAFEIFVRTRHGRYLSFSSRAFRGTPLRCDSGRSRYVEEKSAQFESGCRRTADIDKGVIEYYQSARVTTVPGADGGRSAARYPRNRVSRVPSLGERPQDRATCVGVRPVGRAKDEVIAVVEARFLPRERPL